MSHALPDYFLQPARAVRCCRRKRCAARGAKDNAAVRGPYHSMCTDKMPALKAVEARPLFDSINVSASMRLRDRD